MSVKAKRFRRGGALLLALCMAVCLLPAAAMAKEGPATDHHAMIYVAKESDSMNGTAVYSAGGAASAVSGMSYDQETNTLTLTDYQGADMLLECYMMGDNFKINLSGASTLGKIFALGEGWGGSVTVCGSGTLTVKPTVADSYGFTAAVEVIAGGADARFVVTENATVNLAAYESTTPAVLVSGTQAVAYGIDAGNADPYTYAYGYPVVQTAKVAISGNDAYVELCTKDGTTYGFRWDTDTTASLYTLTGDANTGYAIGALVQSGLEELPDGYTLLYAGVNGWVTATDENGTAARSAMTLTGAGYDGIPFNDVFAGDYYGTPVVWAATTGITQGTGDYVFSPGDNCTRAQVVTFLWRAAGEPEPTKTDNPFSDVNSGDYYYKAVLWAVENGITKGKATTVFAPGDTVTRGEFVTFMYRMAGTPDLPGDISNPFIDVNDPSAYYYDAVLWAVENKITIGTSSSTFSPEMQCSRCQVVTLLYRALVTNATYESPIS